MYPQQTPVPKPSAVMHEIFDTEERLRKFQYLVNRYEINRDFAIRLRALEGYEIVFIVDGKTNLPRSRHFNNSFSRRKSSLEKFSIRSS